MNDKKSILHSIVEKNKVLTGKPPETKQTSIHTKHISMTSHKYNELAAKFDSFKVFVLKELRMFKDEMTREIDHIKKSISKDTAAAKIGYITLNSNGWIGDTTPYYQAIAIEGVTPNSQVDLTPSVEQLLIFYEKDLTFVTENENGVVYVYAIGQKPQNDYTIQVTITEVAYE